MLSSALMLDSSPRGRRFTFHECLGRGGFGEVYRATMRRGRHEEEVAVKVLHVAEDSDSQPVQRLRDEAAMLKKLRHPGILSVHDLVVLRGKLALVTEYVEGADLEELIRSHALSCRAAVDVMAQVLDALTHAFEAREGVGGNALHLIHRDVKPANIRLGRTGAVKLLDFGMARAEMVRSAKTNPDSAFGSFPYMAPEQFTETNAAPTPAIDVYAVGATLFEALSGERLWNVPLKTVYVQALDDGKHQLALDERLSRIRPVALREVLQRMLSHSPDRPGAAQAALDLRATLESLPGKSFAVLHRDIRWPTVRELAGEFVGADISEDFVDVHSIGSPSGPRAPRADTGPTVLFAGPPVALIGADAAATVAPASGADPKSVPRVRSTSIGSWVLQHWLMVTGFVVGGLLGLPILLVIGMVGMGWLMRMAG